MKIENDALESFFEVWQNADMLHDIGPSLTCLEVEVLALLFEANDLPEAAKTLRIGHALADEDGDMEEHLKLKNENEID